MKDEIICLPERWGKCLENLHSIIPADNIRIKNSDRKMSFISVKYLVSLVLLVSNTLGYFRNMNPGNLETNETLNKKDINFEVTNLSEENLNITLVPNQNLYRSPLLQKSCKVYPLTPLKSKTKSLPEEIWNNQPKASIPTPQKMAPTAKTIVSHLVPLKQVFSSCNNPKYSNISKMLMFLFGTYSDIDSFDKLRKFLK